MTLRQDENKYFERLLWHRHTREEENGSKEDKIEIISASNLTEATTATPRVRQQLVATTEDYPWEKCIEFFIIEFCGNDKSSTGNIGVDMNDCSDSKTRNVNECKKQREALRVVKAAVVMIQTRGRINNRSNWM